MSAEALLPETAPNVGGTVAPGFEALREAFHAGLSDLGDGGGAFAAFLDGQLIVDLWGGQARPGGDHPWAADTGAVIMSASKAITVMVVQVLASRGLVDVEAPVARYWPEFAATGKQDVTIRQVLTHTAGLLGFPGQEDHFGWDGTGFDDPEAIEARFASAPLAWPAGTRHGYHALSIGWLLDAVVRRVTAGRSAGRFFAEEVAGPLGIQAWLGTPPDRIAATAEVLDKADLPDGIAELWEMALQVVRDPATLAGQAFIGGNGTSAYEHLGELMNQPRVLASELPAGNATATARGLAKLLSVLADGTIEGVRLISPGALKAFDHVVVDDYDAVMEDMNGSLAALLPRQTVPRTLGYLANGPVGTGLNRFGPNPSSYGAEGMGGQITFCDPDRRLSVAFIRNHMALIPTLGPQLIQALYHCLP